MKKVAELVGAELDYYVARAEGLPADQLEIRPVQRPDPRTPDSICVRKVVRPDGVVTGAERMRYSTEWAYGGPLIEKRGIAPVPFTAMDYERSGVDELEFWGAFVQGKGGHYIDDYPEYADGKGDTPLIAICRAVVRAAFGDEVEDLPCA